jgi:hypothetical protein
MGKRLRDAVYTLGGEGGLALVNSIQSDFKEFTKGVTAAASKLENRRQRQRQYLGARIAAKATALVADVAKEVADAVDFNPLSPASYGPKQFAAVRMRENVRLHFFELSGLMVLVVIVGHRA